MSFTRWSDSEFPDETTEVHLADTYGEMGLWYRLSPISFMASIQLAAATPNHVIQEGGGNVNASHSYLMEPIELLPGGFIAVPNRPG